MWGTETHVLIDAERALFVIAGRALEACDIELLGREAQALDTSPRCEEC